MEQGTSKTPCRRIGLRRITSASKSDATAKSTECKRQAETPKSNVGLFLMSNTGKIAKDVPPSISKSESPVMQTDNESVLKVENTPQSGRKGDSKFPYPFSSPCSSRSDTSKDNSYCQESNAKKLKLDLPETVTVEELHTLQRKVGLKERRLKELRQAGIICRKHNPDDLRRDIKVWLQACQAALQELLSEFHRRGSNMDMTKLLCELGIPSTLVHFNPETGDFE